MGNGDLAGARNRVRTRMARRTLHGRTLLWTRLAPRAVNGERSPAPVRATPIVLLPRRDARVWSMLVRPPEPQSEYQCPRRSRFIQAHGASFFDELVEGVHLLPTQVEAALAELVALGIVNADSYAGLRALLLPVDRRRRPGAVARRRRGRPTLFEMQDAALGAGARGAGRAMGFLWAASAVRRARRSCVARSLGRHVLEGLSARGAVAAAMARTAHGLSQAGSAWRDSRRSLRCGIFGRAVRYAGGHQGVARKPAAQGRRSMGVAEAADPLNVVGLLTPGVRVPSLTGNRVFTGTAANRGIQRRRGDFP